MPGPPARIHQNLSRYPMYELSVEPWPQRVGSSIRRRRCFSNAASIEKVNVNVLRLILADMNCHAGCL